MKSLILLALAFVVVAVVPPAASQSKTTTEIGKWEKGGQGSIGLAIERDGSIERIQIFVVDRHLVDSILFEVEGWELRRLKELIDKAVAELPSEAPTKP